MTKPRRSDPDKLEQARRVAADTAQIRDHIALLHAHPRRLVKYPCGKTTCPACYGTEEQAEHAAKTGELPADHPGRHPVGPDAVTPPHHDHP